MLIEGGGIRDLPASRSQQFVQAIDDGQRPEAGRQIHFEQTFDPAPRTWPVTQPRLQDLTERSTAVLRSNRGFQVETSLPDTQIISAGLTGRALSPTPCRPSCAVSRQEHGQNARRPVTVNRTDLLTYPAARRRKSPKRRDRRLFAGLSRTISPSFDAPCGSDGRCEARQYD